MSKNVKIWLSMTLVLAMMLTTACSSTKKTASSSSSPSNESAAPTATAAPREEVTIRIVEEINAGGVDVSDVVSQEIERSSASRWNT